METLNKANDTLIKMTANIKLANQLRAENVQHVISEATTYAKEHKEVFTDGKKGAVTSFLNNVMANKATDAYTKRAVKIAKFIIIDGYKLKKELLSLAQMEQLICFNKAQVNGLMNLDGDEYVMGAKELINTAKITKTTKVFSPKKARG